MVQATMQTYTIKIIDSKGNEHPNILTKIFDHTEWKDVSDEITKNAIDWCSDKDLSYKSWQF